MPYEIQKKRSSKMVGFLTIAILGAAAITGTTYANLNTKALTETDSEYVKSDYTPALRFNYFHAADNQLLQVDATPKETAQTLVFDKKITNDSALPAHSVLYAEGFDVATLPAAILDSTKVRIQRSDAATGNYIDLTLREFATSGVLFEKIIQPDVSFTVKFTITVPASSAADFTGAVGSFEEKFASGLTFSQAINGSSPLLTHFSKTGNYIKRVGSAGNYIYTVDKGQIATVVAQ